MKKKQLLKLLLASLDGSLTREAIAAQLVEPEAPAAPATPPAPQPVPLAAPGVTLNAWMTTYAKILSERGYKQQTLKNRTANQKHVCRLWGERPLASIRPHEITTGLREFLPDRSSTACRVLSELRDIYVEAVANGCADSSPAAHVKMPKHKIQRCRLTFEVWSSLRAVAQAHPQRWIESLLLLALVTGQRRADLAKMRFDDIVDGHLRIEQQKQAGKGYGARVEIPLTLRLDAIDMTLGDVIGHCRNSARPGPTLLRKIGGGPIEMSSLSARFAECMRVVTPPGTYGEHEWPSLHEVRSLSARLYSTQGVNVQTLLGHKNPEMTAMYIDDRGLSAGQWKRVPLQPVAAPLVDVGGTLAAVAKGATV